MVQIIIPPHRQISEPITNMTDMLRGEITDIRKLLDINEFENHTHALAIAHCQVSQQPLQMFITQKAISASDVFINLEIVSHSNPHIVREGCLSFPYRGQKKVKRFKNCIVKYLDIDLNPHETEVTGLLAQICQHELEHFKGTNIYNV